MKTFKTLIMAIMFVILLTFSVQASDCERYWEELTGQCFETTIGNIDYSICFGGSVFGPCPCGTAILSYTDVQMINDIEYSTDIELEMKYTTSPDIVTVAGIDFMLHAGKLIMLPEDPLILNMQQNR